MTIASGEILWYKSVNISDLSTNGGGLSSNQIISGVRNNVFPDVSQAERTAGSTKYRKVFIKIANASNLAALNPNVMVENLTLGYDSITIFPAGQGDQQSVITGSERQYGCGQLNADVAAAATTLYVMTEAAALNYFQNGDTIRISDKANISAAPGNEEYLVISGVPTYSGNIATITLAAGTANAYAAAATRVASVYQPSTIQASTTSPAVSSTSGTFDNGTYPIVPTNIGAIYDTLVVTFTSASAFGVTSSTLGALSTGTTATDYAPTNAAFSTPYFTLNHLAWGGTWASGDMLTFTVTPAALPLWYKRVVPAGASSVSSDTTTIAVDIESA